MENMEKEKSLQFRQNTNNRGYGFQQTIANELFYVTLKLVFEV